MENIAENQEAQVQPTERKPAPDRIRNNYLLGGVAALVVAVSFMSGNYIGGLGVSRAATSCPDKPGQLVNRSASSGGNAKDVDFAEFWKVWDMVKQKHVAKTANDIDMFYGAIAGMVASVKDPYSVFFDPETAKKFADELSGTFDGIGAEIGMKKSQLTIIAPLPGTPAEKAGLKAGDKILGIDGIDTTGMPVDEAVSRIRGKHGSVVKLMFTREGMKEPKEVSITRATITVDSVKWKTVKQDGKRIGVITLSHFNEDTAGLFSQAVRSVLLDNPNGLILDLRNNPGGFLDTAVKVAGEWAPNQAIVVEKFSDGTKKDYNSDGNARLVDVPTIVLVNGGSASASEIVAGALQDYGKAKLIGEQTFGKGSVQDYQEFDDGSALKLTVALWYTPKGRSINKDGIAPDEIIKLTPEDFDNDRDPQMGRAMEWLLNPEKAAATVPEQPKPAATPAAEPATP